jgi:RNA polymerase sigma-70 factor (ECF subfamily)
LEPATDLQLVDRCLGGDESAWELLVTRYQRAVYNLAYRFTGRFDRAEDLAQEVFVKIYRFLANFHRTRGEFKSWMMVMARNHLIDHLRKERKGWAQSGGTEELEKFDFHSGEKDPAGYLDQREKIRFVHECLQELSPDLRGALILRELEGYSYEEIAEFAKSPLGTIKSRINRGRIELARIMNMRRLQQTPGQNPPELERSGHELQ